MREEMNKTDRYYEAVGLARYGRDAVDRVAARIQQTSE